MHYDTINTQVNTVMYDLRCNAGGARPVKVSMDKARGG